MDMLPLREAHVVAGARFAASGDLEVPAHYGDVAAEYQAVRNSVGLVDCSARGKVRATGNDRMRFLHGMVTNTVSGLTPGAGNHSAVVTVQGQTVMDLWVHHLGDALWLETPPGLAPLLIETLDRYLIADDVTLVDETDAWCVIGVYGPESQALLDRVLDGVPSDLAEYHTVEKAFDGASVWITARQTAVEPGYDVRILADSGAKLWDALIAGGGRPVGFDALEILRIEAGIPQCGAEIDASVTPLEVGLLGAVDFDKGCYVGQEVIAKMHFRGKPRRYLVGLLCDGDAAPVAGQDLMVDGKAIGHVTSSARSPALGRPVALAVVRRGFHEAGQSVMLTDGTEARVTTLPFVGRGARVSFR